MLMARPRPASDETIVFFNVNFLLVGSSLVASSGPPAKSYSAGSEKIPEHSRANTGIYIGILTV
jgi:hypothetical protein